MQARPILSALRRHKTAAALIVVEIALTCAIVCNALFLIISRIEGMQVQSGIADNELVVIQASSLRQLAGDPALNKSVTQDYLAALRGVPGVTHAATATQLPFGRSSSNSGVRLQQDQPSSTLSATVYLDGGSLLDTFGLRLVAGRDFLPEEYVDLSVLERSGSEGRVAGAIINRRMAERLFPGEDALGRTFYSWGSAPIPVVGIVEELVRPNNFSGNQYAMIFPIRSHSPGIRYVLRTAPERRAEVQQAGVAELQRLDPQLLVLSEEPFSDIRSRYFQQDRAMAWTLVIVIAGLLLVTALGIVGLASFWVQQRTRQIGVRRALGATRGQILRYFQLENFLLSGLGIALGMLLAYGLNLALMLQYELPRLPWVYLPAGALVLWALGQLAVWAPARRAAALPPVAALRS